MPGAPSSPPPLPRAGCWIRSNCASTLKGAPSTPPISITWPSPPRSDPAPPVSDASSFRQMTIGATISVASAGMVRTPLGKAVAESPSFVGRAPAPPELKRATSNSGGSNAALRRASLSIAVAPPRSCTIQSEAAPSAGTRSGMA